jgi:hypothetical protein
MAQRVPEYAMTPLKAFLKYLDSSLRLLNISVRGMSLLIQLPAFGEAIAVPLREALPEQWKEEEHQARMVDAKQTASFAANESKAGFPFIHEFVLVGLWGATEAMVQDLIVGLLLNEPALLQNEQFERIKISLADYEPLDKEERMRFLVTELQRTQRTGQRQGINAFEPLLECVGLSGEASEAARKSFWEMNHLRNVIVHHRSLVDRHFANACPWIDIKIGERVCVNEEKLAEYTTMLSGYGVDIVYRLAKRYGVDMSPKDEPPLSAPS